MTDDEKPAPRAILEWLCASAGRPQMVEHLLAEKVAFTEACQRVAAAPGIEELFRVAAAFNKDVDPALGQVLADQGQSVATAAAVLRALTKPRPPDIEIPEGATMH